jgi:hypothetical protein
MSHNKFNRRSFLKSSAKLTGCAFIGSTGFKAESLEGGSTNKDCRGFQDGELLYNGIRLPFNWPPRDMNSEDYEPMPVPYLKNLPTVIPVDTGRQLFVDDFLIEKTDLQRRFHKPIKFEGNPVLSPLTVQEMDKGYCPVAAPFSDGVFYDPADKLFKLWYMAGWFDGTALATSQDGVHFKRPSLDVVPGTNLVLPPQDDLRRDGASLWIDHDTVNSDERYKMYSWARVGKIGGLLKDNGGQLFSSPDGIHWTSRGRVGTSGDNSTFFYNPFRKVWVFTVRKSGRPVPPWSDDPHTGKRLVGRARSYWENSDFFAALGQWAHYDPVFWLGADKFDHRRSHYSIGNEPQLYKVDAVGYESLMLGLLQIHYGPPNSECAKGGFPKLTELQLAFSRDGFHWDRTNRQTFIGATLKKDSWERAYVHSVGGVCNIVGDNLHFYYTAFQGDESKKNRPEQWSGMYANASTGLATLRRDGFASMQAGNEERILFTRRLQFSGKYLFININGTKGRMLVEVCAEDGNPFPGYTRENCTPISVNSTKCRVYWKNHDDLGPFTGRPIRFKFYLFNSGLYSFWVSKNVQGTSGGAIAAGGPGLKGYWDV